MLQFLRELFGFHPPSSSPPKEQSILITPELHDEMLAKKAAVAERRENFWESLSPKERLKRQTELQKRISSKTPMLFKFVKETEGTPVGFPLFIFHITLHDMFAHECQWRLTEEVLLAGLTCNAVSVGRFVRLDDLEGFYEVQPRWVEELGKAA